MSELIDTEMRLTKHPRIQSTQSQGKETAPACIAAFRRDITRELPWPRYRCLREDDHQALTLKTCKMLLNDGRFSSTKGVQLTIYRLSNILMVVMVFGFFMSIALAIIYSFEETTATHCKVKNYLPSISAAIGKPPSSYMWRFVVVLCAGQRLFLVTFHYCLYTSVKAPIHHYQLLCKACFSFEFVENLALIGLTCVSSSENFSVHENMFIIFQVCSMIFMVLMCSVHKLAITSGMPPSVSEQKTLSWLYACCGTNMSSFLIAIYFFFRHNSYCETGVYTLFAFFEYIVVLSNIAFHYTVTSNFQERELVLGSRINIK